MFGRKKTGKSGRSFNPIATTKGFTNDIKSSVLGFESNPLVNASYLLTTFALICSISTFVISAILAVNNIQLAGQALSGSSAHKFLSAGEVYYGSISSMVFVLLFIAAFVLLVIYKVKSPVRNGGDSISWLAKYWGMSAVIMLVAAPIILLFAENILVIVGSIIVVAALYFYLSAASGSTGGSSSSSASSKSTHKKNESKVSGNIMEVDRSWKIFKASTIQTDNQIWAYNPAFDSREDWILCSYRDFKNKKVLIMRKGSSTPLTEKDLDSIPQGFKDNHGLK